MNVSINSEIGKIEGVIIHTPGNEVSNMTPKNVERALYSDILNMRVVQKEYKIFKTVLNKFTTTYEIRDLLIKVCENEKLKDNLVNRVCNNENPILNDYLMNLTNKDLANQLIEGVLINKDTLTKFLSRERFELAPLHNFFFTRDASVAINNNILISRMNDKVRERESLIMESIFSLPDFKTKIINNSYKNESSNNITIEGGDILIASDDIILIGIGARTTSKGVDFLLEKFKALKTKKHIIIQELPKEPESFIHLDMVFTFLDYNKCLVFKPVILNRHNFQTIHITLDNGKVKSIVENKNILVTLNELGFEVEPVYCGGNEDEWTQEREQWHSGANFFALAPGKIIGYGRNERTIEELNSHGFEIIRSQDFLEKDIPVESLKKCVITIKGSELSRGGGGCRCMTMPIRRQNLKWD